MSTPSSNSIATTKPFHIVQIGCGVVGYAYVKAYLSAGCKVTMIEASPQLIAKYKKDHTIYHTSDDLTGITDVDFMMLSICTPQKGDDLDMSYLYSSVPNVATILKKSPKAQVIIRSTIVPTVSDRYTQMIESATGHKVDVLFQPEFLRADTAFEDALNPWHIVLGAKTETSTTKLLELYTKFAPREDISVISIDEAELLKLFHNCYNAFKISDFNLFWLLCEAINKRTGKAIDVNAITKMMREKCKGLLEPEYGTVTGQAYNETDLLEAVAKMVQLEKLLSMPVSLFECVAKVNDQMGGNKAQQEATIDLDSLDQDELSELFVKAFNASKISAFNYYKLVCEAINKRDGKSIDVNVITKVMSKTCEGLLNVAYATATGHAYYGTCLPKDSVGLAKQEKILSIPVSLYAGVVAINNLVKARDQAQGKGEILKGDHHMSFDKFKRQKETQDEKGTKDEKGLTESEDLDLTLCQIDVKGESFDRQSQAIEATA